MITRGYQTYGSEADEGRGGSSSGVGAGAGGGARWDYDSDDDDSNRAGRSLVGRRADGSVSPRANVYNSNSRRRPGVTTSAGQYESLDFEPFENQVQMDEAFHRAHSDDEE